ncbi:MAG: adenylate/guanylate cyclase domain-containing protein [Betaproteobacteria bacterium]
MTQSSWRMQQTDTALTIVFADITDSTGLFLRLGDLAAIRLEQDWIARVKDLVSRFEGTFVKAIGDEAMCAFLSPQALLAACEIQTMTAKPPTRSIRCVCTSVCITGRS